MLNGFSQYWSRFTKRFFAPSSLPTQLSIMTKISFSPRRVQLENGKTGLIRLATLQEVASIFCVESEAYEGNPPWDLKAFQNDFQKNLMAVYLVFLYKEQVVGFVGGRCMPNLETHISNLAVMPDYRYLGCATLLMNALEEVAKELGQTKITLEVRQSNLKAQKLYYNLGFEKIGEKKQYYLPDLEDAYDMQKNIQETMPESLLRMDFSFRRLTDSQLASTLFTLMADNYEHASNWTLAGIQENMEQESCVYYGVFCQKELIGFASFQKVLDEATLTNIVIRRDYQRQKLAERLWNLSVYDLEDLGVRQLFLEVRVSNTTAQSFYEKMGWQRYHVREDYYQEPREDALMYQYQIGKGGDSWQA